MTLEEDMKLEIRRLKNEIAVLDMQADNFGYKISDLLKLQRKKEKDIKILKSNFGELRFKEKQITLVSVI